MLASAITAISAVVTATVGWIGDYMGAIMAQGSELLLIFFAMPLVGLGIGALKRLAS
jgi:hypothetical protein